MNDPDSFDLIVVGAGSGNTIPTGAMADWRIAIVDDGPMFGGTCLNAGCIPTKMFVHVAALARDAREGERLGLRGVRVDADWHAVRDRVFGRIDAISRSGESYRSSGEPNVSLVREAVRFTGERELVTASGRRLTASRIVIAAGSRPRELEAVPIGPRVHTSDSIMRLEELPGRLAIIGGGAVASEFAAMLSAFGVRVTQIARSQLLRASDPQVASRFAREAAKRWEVRTGVQVESVDRGTDGLGLALSDGDRLEADAVLVAAGRVPNTDRLGTAAVGFDHHPDGRVRVDAQQRVVRGGRPVPGLFALGDISADHALKHVANHEARIVQHNLVAGDGELLDNELGPVPHVVFSHPQVAAFGMTLAEASRLGYDAFEVSHDYGATAWGWALEDEGSFCKLVVARGSATLLGAHIIGPDAAILLQPLLQAASYGQSIRGLARGQYWPHPAATEVVENALLRAEEEL